MFVKRAGHWRNASDQHGFTLFTQERLWVVGRTIDKSFSYVFPSPIEALVHGTVMRSWVSSVNIFDLVFDGIEWALKED